MSTANYLLHLEYSTDGLNWNDMNGIKDITLESERATLDTTAFNTNNGWKNKIKGLKDFTLSLSGDWLPADAGQSAARTANLSSDDDEVFYIRYRPDGTNGFSCRTVISTISGPSGGVGDIASTSIEMEGAGDGVSAPLTVVS